mmetsp:Transcript_114412/g.369692  ORF Transcript_114412/g.369692 Transcript_114412/m.369692 type:complete len:211 (+) Transcript_114412:1038-1670(+)
MSRKRISSRVKRILLRPVACTSLTSGAHANTTDSIAQGQNFTAATMARSMNMMPMIGKRIVWTALNSPPRLNKTLKRTSDRMSSTKAAVMIAWPKFSCNTPASPSNRNEMPTLVGARAVPAEMPWGMPGFPYAMTRRQPVASGMIVPITATTHAQGPTSLAFSKSKCMPLSKIMRATPACPISVKTSGVSEQWCLTSASHVFSRHSPKES